MGRAAFLTMADTGGWSIDSDLAFAPLERLGWRCEWQPWNADDVDWDSFDAVYIAATWDYPDDPDAFLLVMERIEQSSATLVNPIDLVRWNIPKTYLRDLEQRGAAIVPSRWYDRFDECSLDEEFAVFATQRLIVKPVVSTNANNTFLLQQPVEPNLLDRIAAVFAERAFVVQPFIEAIRDEGEFSLFYIGGELSHGIRKVPKRGDFRVQEEHGADIRAVAPGPELRRVADAVMSLVEPAPLYARCDFVRDASAIYRVMELELIEPSLYLRMDTDAPARFATAFDAHVSRIRGNNDE